MRQFIILTVAVLVLGACGPIDDVARFTWRWWGENHEIGETLLKEAARKSGRTPEEIMETIKGTTRGVVCEELITMILTGPNLKIDPSPSRDEVLTKSVSITTGAFNKNLGFAAGATKIYTDPASGTVYIRFSGFTPAMALTRDFC